MQRLSLSIGAYISALFCLALSCANVCADDRYSARRAIAVDTVRSKVVRVANTIFNSGLSENANDSALYSALVEGFNEAESDEGFVWFQIVQMEITEQYFKACYGRMENRPSVGNIGFHIQQFVTIIGTSPLDISALRNQFSILICLHQQVTGPKPACNTVDCSRGLGNATTTGEFFCCLQVTDVRDLFGIESPVTTTNPVPCLALVVDSSGSMSVEIAAVQGLINGFLNPADPVCYILIEFNDFGSAANSAFLRAVFDPTGTIAGGTLAQLMAAVNALSANGGGDCPEFGMTGLQIALNQINGLPPLAASLSQIILITDASAKDDFLFMNVIAQASTLGVPIHELLIRTGCPGFLNFPLVAMSTGGIVVNNLADFGTITNFVQASLVAGGFGGDATMFGPALSSHNVSVSKFARTLQILIRSNQALVKITRPNNMTEVLSLSGTLFFFEDENPASGDWMFSVASGTLEIAVNKPILLDFFVSHVVNDTDSDGIEPVCEPRSCSRGRVAVSSSRLSDIDLTHPIYLAIVNTTGGIIDEVQLQPCTDVLVCDDYLSFPPEEFRYRLRGYDCNGNMFAYTPVKFVVELQPPSTIVLDDHDGLSLILGKTENISVQLQHTAFYNTLFFSVTGSDGLTLECPTNDVVVPAGGIFTLVVAVTVSSDLASGSIAFINLTVEDSCSNITETFHWPVRIEPDPCDPDPCDPNAAVCEVVPATDPGFICTCISPFVGDGFECQQPDPCDPDPCDPNAVCEVAPATDPGFICTCISHFVGDGFECQRMMMGDDPHFSIVLPSGKLLCYTVQGEHGFSFNLISSAKLYVNAMFVPDSRREEVTWLGSIGIVVMNNAYKKTNHTLLRFEAKENKIYYGDKLVLEARNIKKLTFNNDKLIISEAPPVEGFKYPSVYVDLQDADLRFNIKFMNEHLDLFWHSTGQQVRDSHGLIGQFFRREVEIDEVRKILILPGKEPVPVMRRPAWSFMEREVPDDQLCWTAMNPGYQGEGLIDGTYFDYLVNDVLSTNFVFKKRKI